MPNQENSDRDNPTELGREDEHVRGVSDEDEFEDTEDLDEEEETDDNSESM
jgi:hypothetical protein